MHILLLRNSQVRVIVTPCKRKASKHQVIEHSTGLGFRDTKFITYRKMVQCLYRNPFRAKVYTIFWAHGASGLGVQDLSPKSEPKTLNPEP